MKDALATMVNKATDLGQMVKEFLEYFSSGQAWHEFVMHAILYIVIGIVIFVLINTVFDSVRNAIRGLDVSLIGVALTFIGFKLKDVPLLNEFASPLLILGGILVAVGIILFILFKKTGKTIKAVGDKVSGLVSKDEDSDTAESAGNVQTGSGKKSVKTVAAVILALVLGFGVGQFVNVLPGNSSNGATVDSISGIIKDNVDLSVMDYEYEEVVSLDPDSLQIKGKKIPFTTKSAQVQFSGIAKMGPDLDKADVDVKDISKKIVVTVPHSKVLSNSIDEKSFEVKNEKNGLFNKINLSDSSTVRQKGKELIEKKIKSENMLDDADEKAAEELEKLLAGSYADYDVVIEFK